MNRNTISPYLQSKRFLYCACFFLMALVDQQLASAPGFRQILFSRGVFTFVLILILSHWKSSGKSVRSRNKMTHCSLFLAGLFFLFFILSAVSRYDYKWILLHFGVFFIFYLTPFSAEEAHSLLSGMQDGILLSFFVIQGLAFVFRPYDVLRYPGMYANTNINALYYVIVYSILIGRVLTLQKGLLRLLHFILSCSMWSFVVLTMCRSAFLAMFAITLLAVFYLVRQSLLVAAGYLGFSVAVAVLCFPLVYGAVRYIPSLFHHPIWFYDEYSEDKVHSFDPVDSPKYTHWKDVLEGNFGRFVLLGEGISQTNASQEEIAQEEMAQVETAPTEASQAETLPPEAVVPEEIMEPGAEITTDAEDSLPDEELNSASARLTIYRHYLHSLNLWGHTEAENGVQITSDYFAPHAHDLFLQYFFHFGIPAGIIFLVFMVLCGLRLLYLAFFPEPSPYYIIPLLTWAGVMVFGLTEMMWRMGQLSFMLMFLLPLWAVLPAHNVAFPHNQNS